MNSLTQPYHQYILHLAPKSQLGNFHEGRTHNHNRQAGVMEAASPLTQIKTAKGSINSQI